MSRLEADQKVAMSLLSRLLRELHENLLIIAGVWLLLQFSGLSFHPAVTLPVKEKKDIGNQDLPKLLVLQFQIQNPTVLVWTSLKYHAKGLEVQLADRMKMFLWLLQWRADAETADWSCSLDEYFCPYWKMHTAFCNLDQKKINLSRQMYSTRLLWEKLWSYTCNRRVSI